VDRAVRFVDAEVLSVRFGVSRRQVNARLERLERAGLVQRRGGRGVAGADGRDDADRGAGARVA
jgi:DNA-binding FadR family transcriptional regulator